MPLSWKALGRTLEIITIVLLIVAVRYLWIKADSKTTESPETTQVEIQVPEANTEAPEHPLQPQVPTQAEADSYQPPIATSADTESYQQSVERAAPSYVVRSYVPLAPDFGCYRSPMSSKTTNSEVAVTPTTSVKITVPRSASPNSVIEEAAMLLDEAISDRRKALAENKIALFTMIDEILSPRFDRRYAAQLVLSRHWRTASAEERDRFVNAFYCHTIRRFAEDMLEFDLARLTILPFRDDATKKRTTVKTFMKLDNGTKSSVNYGMVKRDSGWKIFDVTTEGISYVRNFKADINAEIQLKGLGGVIARLEAGTSTGDEE